MNRFKSIFLFSITLFSLLGCKRQVITKVVAAYPNGQTKTELIMSPDEKINYEQISYFDDGTISIQGKFKNNKRHGRWESFFMNGKPNSVNNYNEGEYDGEYLIYNKDGNLVLKGNYKNGLKYGTWTTFDDDGKVADLKKFDEHGKQIEQK